MKRKWFFFLLLAMVVGSVACSSQKDNHPWAVMINREEVPVGEFMVYLLETQKRFEALGGSDIWETNFDGKTAEEAAKESALTACKTVKIAVQKAKALSVALNADELAAAKSEAEQELQQLTEAQLQAMGTTHQMMLQVMEDKAIYNQVYQKIIADYEISEADFNVYYEQNASAFRKNRIQYTLEEITVADPTTAEELWERANQGESFDALAKSEQQSLVLQEQPTVTTLNKEELVNRFGVDFDLEQGEMSDVLTETKGYTIVRVLENKSPSEAEVKKYARQYYIDLKKQQLFQKEYGKWEEASTVEKNNEVWANIHILDT